VSWASKKQNSVALSTAEAEYIDAGHCCVQLLSMRQTLRDYGVTPTLKIARNNTNRETISPYVGLTFMHHPM
jgi:hypothetical protein